MMKVLTIVLSYLLASTSAALVNPAATNPLLRNVGGCPLCDSSVYSYCDYKLTHDACCCTGPYAGAAGGLPGLGFGTPFGKNTVARIGLPFQCQYNDCSFLYANSCVEMSLIRDCCCNSPYR